MSMTPTPPVPPAPPSRAPGPGVALSLFVATAGLVIGIVAAVAIIIPFADRLSSDEYPVPGAVHLHLKSERYTVFEREGFSSSFAGLSLTPAALTVTAADRSTVPVTYDGHNETLSHGSVDYHGTLSFEPPSSGDYTLTFTNRVPTTVIVERPIEDIVRGVLVWFGVGAIGGALLLAGIVMLIIGVTRRGRAKRAAYAAYGPPGGAWYQVGPPAQWTPPAGAPGYQPPGYPPPGYPSPGYPPPGYGGPGAAPQGYPPPPPAYPPPAYPPPAYQPPPAPPAPSAPPEPSAPPDEQPDQPNP